MTHNRNQNTVSAAEVLEALFDETEVHLNDSITEWLTTNWILMGIRAAPENDEWMKQLFQLFLAWNILPRFSGVFSPCPSLFLLSEHGSVSIVEMTSSSLVYGSLQ